MEREIKVNFRDIDEAVYYLLALKAKGEHVYYNYDGHILHSDTVTLDGAYLEIIGRTKAEQDEIIRKSIEEFRRKQAREEQKIQENQERITSSRKGEIIITEDLVVEGLKFIAEHRDLSQEELIDGLLDLGCSFNYEDINKQFPEEESIPEGLLRGNLRSGAIIIANVRDNEFGRSIMEENFFDNDNDLSIYHFIRTVTQDDTYTKETIDKINKGKRI